MKADFSGYATRAGIKCTDGRIIMQDAFKHQDQQRVPLVWQHGHKDPENVLGHAILENRPDGVYAYAFFNKTKKAVHAAELVEHKDINALSIWANQLIQRGEKVVHGAIREVSLVLAGANPGALIENVTIRHSDGDDELLDDEAIVYSGLEIEHDDMHDETETETNTETESTKTTEDKETKDIAHADDDEDGESIQDVYDSMNDKQKDVLHYMIGQALESAAEDDSKAEHDNLNDKEGNTTMGTRSNVFEKTETSDNTHVLSHDDMKAIVSVANQRGSLKAAVTEYALEHGINDIDQLFPDAKAISDVPEWIKRRTEWVSDLLGAVRKSPFSRIKTLNADITMDQARAKGYIKGTLKKEEFFTVAKRVTTPTTIYKKQALDRDDMIDITDFDVVAWLKAEMRLMLDEELARAILIGDGRDISDEDKINEQNIRPIASDHELYTTVVNVNVGDANSSMLEVSDAILLNRAKLKGTGLPTFFTTEYWIARFLMVRDGDNRRMWRNLDELATELRVSSIVAVEVMLESPDIIGIMVNPVDYVLGADKGGQVSMFDDFDIDYNKQKYLIETRCSGALTKIKSAMVIKSMTGTDTLAVPAVPTFDPETGALTITNTTGVVYKHGVTVVNAAGSPYTVDPGDTWVIDATPATGYYFATSDDDQWSFTADA
jgi:IMP dehydrogenase/GMP reductase